VAEDTRFVKRSTANFRTHAYYFAVLDKMVPDFLVEHLLRERIFRLKTRTPFAKTRTISRSAKNALINNRLHI
jgi:hypothetical protein